MSSCGRSYAHRLRSAALAGSLAVGYGLCVACASAGGGRAPTVVAPLAAVSGQALVQTALAFRGTPYRRGGNSPSGFDCSGFVQYIFAQHGIRVPRVVQAQVGVGQPVKRGRIAAGDLVFFRLDGRAVSHVGIAVGGGTFVHAPKERGTVRVESLDAPYWSRHYAEARRVTGG